MPCHSSKLLESIMFCETEQLHASNTNSYQAEMFNIIPTIGNFAGHSGRAV
jgi:hypothetical protein